ncbi:MAG: EamA family transporter, partial [Verrucomicrobia bacterium]|nr:EamA family transporter [Verrucomicrobiota bacterium]
RHLQAYEAALFTITTPIFVTLFADALDRRLRGWALAAALLAVAGTALVAVKSTDLAVTFTGLALVQLSNAAFAIGQVLYCRLRVRQPALRDHEVFALPYAGGVAVAAAMFATRGASLELTTPQWLTLAYLGLLASGAGFFLWNVGATRVSSGTLAVMNNAKVPLGVACALLVFGERADVPWLLASFALLGAAVWLAGLSASNRTR